MAPTTPLGLPGSEHSPQPKTPLSSVSTLTSAQSVTGVRDGVRFERGDLHGCVVGAPPAGAAGISPIFVGLASQKFLDAVAVDVAEEQVAFAIDGDGVHPVQYAGLRTSSCPAQTGTPTSSAREKSVLMRMTIWSLAGCDHVLGGPCSAIGEEPIGV
jgi:hypothetical protein